MIKDLVKSNRLTLGVIFGSALLFSVISFFSEKVIAPEKGSEDLKKVIVPVDGQKYYPLEGSVTSPLNLNKTLSYSLLFPANLIRETKLDGQETIFYYKGHRVAILNFYYFPEKITKKDFAMNVLGQKYVLAVDTKEYIFGDVSYITASAENSYYRIASFKGGEWIGMIEMLGGNDTLEKQLLDSLKVR